MILLTDEEIKELDINLMAGILAHHAMAVKNGRDPTLETSEALSERRKVAKAQLKKVVEWGIERCQEHYRGGGVFSRRECPKCWKDLLDEVKDE